MEISKSFFTDPENIMALRSEHLRTIKPNDPSAKLVTLGLQILDYIYCLKNPKEHDAAYIHRLDNFALGLFKQAARDGNSLGLFLEGVANVQGFCQPQDMLTELRQKNICDGKKQINLAAERKCAEALNFLAMRFAKKNSEFYMMLLRDAAYGGHAGARRAYANFAKKLRMQISKQRKRLAHKQILHRRKIRRRRIEEFYAQPRHKYVMH